jgi:hypothetical protein
MDSGYGIYRISILSIISSELYLKLKYIQNYWGFLLCSSFGILKTRKHYVSETGSVSVLR